MIRNQSVKVLAKIILLLVKALLRVIWVVLKVTLAIVGVLWDIPHNALFGSRKKRKRKRKFI